MTATKSDIIVQLKKEILSLQGFKTKGNAEVLNILPSLITEAFPNSQFPTGAVHEFLSDTAEDAATTCGFVSGILSSLMHKKGACIWITSSLSIFPNALSSFGITPDKVIFINLKKEKEILWATEEALKFDGLAAVVAETKELSFTNSRRLQLAVEQSHVTGFILRCNPKTITSTACVSRWKITSLQCQLEENMPGVGFPRWNVELLKIRNGKPGTWQIEFMDGKFYSVYKTIAIPQLQQKKTG
ncbi:MAG: Error-prone repair protein ImuA [Ginsengibacter sp.]